MFNPDASKANTAQISTTSWIKNGKYELKTNAIITSESGPGVPKGWYKVTVRCNLPGEDPPTFEGQPAYSIHRKYMDAEKTPVSVEVVDNPQPGHYDIKVTSK